MNWKAFLKGLTAAAIGGAATGGATALQGTPVSGKQVAAAALAGAIVGVASYFKQSPLPPAAQLRQADPPVDPGPQG